MNESAPLWSPSPKRIAQANLTRFLGGFRTYDELYRWSIEQPEEFWPAVWRFCGVKCSRMWDRVTTPHESVRQARWFEGAQLNFAGNLLRHQDDEPAIIARNESGARRMLTHRELFSEVSRMRRALEAAGVGLGDRVAGYLPNVPEAVIAMLATTSLGAIWSSCSPDFGVEGVLDRFSQISPKVIFAADGVLYAGKRVETLPRLREICAALPGVKQAIVVTLEDQRPDLSGLPRALRWQDAIAFYPGCQTMRFVSLPFDHPVYILYSSGTTGLPKCMTHGGGGTLLQHLKELVLHTDVKPTDRVFYHTTCGWMMWNWLVSTLATGAAIVLWDGSPLYPSPRALWDMAEAERVTVFGTSARYLSLIEKEGLRPRETHNLGALRTILSTGSPLLPESFDYVYRDIHPDVQLSSISGGTDIAGCFALGNPIAPVYRGEIQACGLGMRVEVLNDAGQAVIGERGELVCHPPFPSMPVSFWNDPDETCYRNSYFMKYPGVWRHGDWAELTPRGGMVITGRSDTTLNPGGVRIGTAEIYRQVERIAEVLESLAVGRPVDGDVQVALFVKLRPGAVLDAALERRIRLRLHDHASPHHVPHRIFQVDDLPRTLNGKISETAVRDRIEGREVRNTHALANPESLAQFRKLEE